jgi:hypothetical protein
MTTAPTFLPAKARPYALHKQAELAPDRERLTELAKALDLQPDAWRWLALEQLALYRDAARQYRDALVELDALHPLPNWVPLETSL